MGDAPFPFCTSFPLSRTLGPALPHPSQSYHIKWSFPLFGSHPFFRTHLQGPPQKVGASVEARAFDDDLNWCTSSCETGGICLVNLHTYSREELAFLISSYHKPCKMFLFVSCLLAYLASSSLHPKDPVYLLWFPPTQQRDSFPFNNCTAT